MSELRKQLEAKVSNEQALWDKLSAHGTTGYVWPHAVYCGCASCAGFRAADRGRDGYIYWTVGDIPVCVSRVSADSSAGYGIPYAAGRELQCVLHRAGKGKACGDSPHSVCQDGRNQKTITE